MSESSPFLEGLRVVECSMLEPGTLGMVLAGFGADVIKVEQPGQGDYVRQMAWPFVDGVSLLHWHVNRGKRSIALDLNNAAGKAVFVDLARSADVVIEGMRPGALERKGIGPHELHRENPRLIFVTLSGYGVDGPYRDLPSHGVAYDAWAGVARPQFDEEGRPYIADGTPVGTRTAPVWAAAAVMAALIRARARGQGAVIDVAQTDAAAITNWLAIEGEKAYTRPADHVTGNPSDRGVRRAPGLAGMEDAVRYQFYRSRDGMVLFMASEREFWRNFCSGIGRTDLFSRYPGERYADHARGNDVLRAELEEIFATRTTAEWLEFANRVNTPICPVNDAKSILSDEQFAYRLPFEPAEEAGADLMPLPVHLVGEQLPRMRKAPRVGEHTAEILREVLGYAPELVDGLRIDGAFGDLDLDPDRDVDRDLSS
ncbi:MAG TPA: CaiB/BaiF CoA-transferase family protein [Acidimicrobiales bacterium]|nr:CaiB/BaiF CoA-transferase family protein [Acidimicrobiales bacterium]